MAAASTAAAAMSAGFLREMNFSWLAGAMSSWHIFDTACMNTWGSLWVGSRRCIASTKDRMLGPVCRRSQTTDFSNDPFGQHTGCLSFLMLCIISQIMSVCSCSYKHNKHDPQHRMGMQTKLADARHTHDGLMSVKLLPTMASEKAQRLLLVE